MRAAALILAAAAACDHRLDLGGPSDATVDVITVDADPCAAPLPCAFPSRPERTSICGTVAGLDGVPAPRLTLRIADALDDTTLTTLSADECARFAAPDIVLPASGLAAVIVDADFPTVTLVVTRAMSLNDRVNARAVSADADAAWSAVTGAPTHAGSTVMTFVDADLADVAIESPNPVYRIGDAALSVAPESATGGAPIGCHWPALDPDAPDGHFLIMTVKPVCP